MAAPLLAEALGGAIFLGFIAAVAFATILAVVAGLTLAGAGALAHDLYINVIKKGKATEEEQVKVARIGALLLGLLAIILGIVFKVWCDILKNPQSIFPWKNPALISMSASFLVAVIVSLLTPERQAQEKFEEEKIRTYLGVGIE